MLPNQRAQLSGQGERDQEIARLQQELQNVNVEVNVEEKSEQDQKTYIKGNIRINRKGPKPRRKI